MNKITRYLRTAVTLLSVAAALHLLVALLSIYLAVKGGAS